MWLEWWLVGNLLAIVTINACFPTKEAFSGFVVRQRKFGQLVSRILCAMLPKAPFCGTYRCLLFKVGISRQRHYGSRGYCNAGLGSQGLAMTGAAVTAASCCFLNKQIPSCSSAALRYILILLSTGSAAHAASDYAGSTASAFFIPPYCHLLAISNTSAGWSATVYQNTFCSPCRPLPWACELPAFDSISLPSPEHSCNAEVYEASQYLPFKIPPALRKTSNATFAETNTTTEGCSSTRKHQGSSLSHDCQILLCFGCMMIVIAYMVAVMNNLGLFVCVEGKARPEARQHAVACKAQKHRPRRHSHRGVQVRLPKNGQHGRHQHQQEAEVDNEFSVIYAFCQPLVAVLYWALRPFAYFIYKQCLLKSRRPLEAESGRHAADQHNPSLVGQHADKEEQALPAAERTPTGAGQGVLAADTASPVRDQDPRVALLGSLDAAEQVPATGDEEKHTWPAAEQTPSMAVQVALTAGSASATEKHTPQMALVGTPARTERGPPTAAQGRFTVYTALPTPELAPHAAEVTPETTDVVPLSTDLVPRSAIAASFTAYQIPCTADLIPRMANQATRSAQQAPAADSAVPAPQHIFHVVVANANSNVESVSALQQLPQQVPANQQQQMGHQHQDQVQAVDGRIKSLHSNVHAIACDATSSANGGLVPVALPENESVCTASISSCHVQRRKDKKEKMKHAFGKFFCCVRRPQMQE